MVCLKYTIDIGHSSLDHSSVSVSESQNDTCTKMTDEKMLMLNAQVGFPVIGCLCFTHTCFRIIANQLQLMLQIGPFVLTNLVSDLTKHIFK